jgi:hypothetical protein
LRVACSFCTAAPVAPARSDDELDLEALGERICATFAAVSVRAAAHDSSAWM